MLDKFNAVVVPGFCFFLGRMSYLVFKNKYLEDKRAELVAYHKELLDIQASLEKKDVYIRSEWQEMVKDFSKYQAAMYPDETGKWTDMDDVYFRSWNSAER